MVVVVVVSDDSTMVVWMVVVVVPLTVLMLEIVWVAETVLVEVMILGWKINVVVSDRKTTVLVVGTVVVDVRVLVIVCDVNETVMVLVSTSGAGKTHITATIVPQSTAGNPVIRTTSKYEHDGSAIVLVSGLALHGPPGLSRIDEIAVAICPDGGMLVRVKALAVHWAAASLSGAGSKKMSGS